jgi:hypothetical protein
VIKIAFPANFNFSYYQGDRYEFVIRPKQANGEPFDLSGYNGLYTIATQRGNPAAIIDSPKEATVDAPAGTVTVVIDPDFGQTLTGNSYLYDVEISNSLSNVFTLVTGNIGVTRDITNTFGGS